MTQPLRYLTLYFVHAYKYLDIFLQWANIMWGKKKSLLKDSPVSIAAAQSDPDLSPQLYIPLVSILYSPNTPPSFISAPLCLVFLSPGMQINGQRWVVSFQAWLNYHLFRETLHQEVEHLFFRIPIALGVLHYNHHLVPLPLLCHILTFFEDKYYQLFFFISVPTAGIVLVTSQTFSNYFKNEWMKAVVSESQIAWHDLKSTF